MIIGEIVSASGFNESLYIYFMKYFYRKDGHSKITMNMKSWEVSKKKHQNIIKGILFGIISKYRSSSTHIS